MRGKQVLPLSTPAATTLLIKPHWLLATYPPPPAPLAVP